MSFCSHFFATDIENTEKESLESKKDYYEEIFNENLGTASKIKGLLSSLPKHVEKRKKGERKYRKRLEVENQEFFSLSSITTCMTHLRKEETIL